MTSKKTGIIFGFLFLYFSVSMLSAEPPQTHIDLVEKYKDLEIDTTRLKPDHEWPDQKLYRFDDFDAWVFTNGYIVVKTAEKLRINIYPDRSRISFFFEDGRSCIYYPDAGRLEWSLTMELAPDFDLPVIGDSDRHLKLSDLRGSVVVLDFWASWCGPCREYLPETEELHKKYKEMGLIVLGINVEGNDNSAKDVIDSLNLTFDMLRGGPGEDGRYNWSCKQISDFGINGIPSVFLIDKAGIIRYNNTILRDTKLIETLLAE